MYTVKKGDTLYGLYGPDWKKLSGYTGDPTKLQIGTQLPDLPGKEKSILSQVEETYQGLGLGQSKEPEPGLPGLGEEVSNRALGGGVVETSPADKLLADLTSRLTEYSTAPTLTEEKKRLEEEKGVLGLETTVGSFEDEIAKTQTLLDNLEENITQRTKDYLVTEPQRERVLAAEQEPLIKQLGTLERGYTAASGKLERTQADILTELGLIEKEKTTPLDLLEREVNIRSQIKSLTEKDIPNAISTTFDDAGNMTIVTQDPTTGAFKTQTIQGIGEKAQKYQTITSQTDNEGNLTIIGITRDGKAETLGSFKGVSEAKTTTVTTEEKPLSISEVRKYQEDYPDVGIEMGDTATTANEKVRYNFLITQGFSLDQARDVETSDTAPDWFRTQAEQEYQMSLTSSALDALWKSYKEALLRGGTALTPGKTSFIGGTSALETLMNKY